MIQYGLRSGLTVPSHAPSHVGLAVEDVITEEAGFSLSHGTAPRVSLEVEEGAIVAQGAPVARLRDAHDICFVAPIPCRVARIVLLNGHRLSEIVFFHEPGGAVVTHNTSGTTSEAGLRRLMQRAGFWHWLQRRPFGGIPGADERPAAIFVMATDTRPFAPDPRIALKNRKDAFSRGLRALGLLADGRVFLCQQPGPALIDKVDAQRVTVLSTGPRHPQGASGLRIHATRPAEIDSPVWDIHAEDVASLGDLLETGHLPMTRLVSVGGSALRESRMVRTQPGADLRGLIYRHVLPGSHRLLSGSLLDGRPAHWLAGRDRQVTALPREKSRTKQHWLVKALTRSASPKPVIPTAALGQAFGGMLPSAAFVRALSSGDDETAMQMGVLSLLEEDITLPDYVLGGDAHLPTLLRGMLDRIRKEFAA